ncbi:MAG: rhomboid family intramembrane serine protease [Acidobacteriia bacterium]|nr:rhomboid family intramembrane serine protease [Terriglobia bacterium]
MANCVQCGRKLPALMFGRKICQWCVQHEAAQRGEEPENAVQRVEAAPWLRRQSTSMVVTQAFFGINVAVFLAMALAGVSIMEPTWQELVQWQANFAPLTVSGQWWRLLTCVFVHIGIIHIGFNMWCLWDLGRLAESLYGHWTFGSVYLITGVAASVTSAAWHPTGLSAGASGAIFGIAGALIASFYLGEFSLPRAAVAGTLRSVVMFAGYNLVFGAMWGRTDNAAHVGGLVSGLILGALIARLAPTRDEPFRRVAVLLVGLLLVAGGITWLHRSRAYIFSMDHARQSLAVGNTDDAIPRLETVVRQHPDYAPAHFELARAYVIKRDFAKAEMELKRVIELNPRNEGAFYVLGFTELELKRPQQAREAFTQLLKLNPNSADAHSGLAAVFSFENKYSEALEEYKRTAQLDPEYQSVFYDMGLMQSKLKLYDDAIASFLKQRDNGDDPDNEEALADSYQAKGMQREAEDARQRAKQFRDQH